MNVAFGAEESSGGARCGLCGATGRVWRRKAGFDVLLCTRCGNGFVPKERVPNDLETLYSKEYFEGDRSTGYPGYLSDSTLLRQNFEDRLRIIESLSPPGKRLLDVGAAYGVFLKTARDRGWDASGIEIAPECAVEAAKLSGASVMAGDFLSVPASGVYDVIVMLDVIEHFRDPAACVRHAFNLLAPGGWLVIETGDRAAPWARLLGNIWYFLDPPQHLFYFSRKGLVTLLRQAGFAWEVRVKRIGRRVSTANVLFKLSAGVPRGALKRTLGAVSRAGIGGALYLNFGDGMFVAARKP